MADLRFRIEEFLYRRRHPMYSLRCEVGLHHPGFWSDLTGTSDGPEPYWHCDKCAAEAYPLFFRIADRIPFLWRLYRG